MSDKCAVSLKLVGMIGKAMIATLGENHAGNCNKESLHQLTVK